MTTIKSSDEGAKNTSRTNVGLRCCYLDTGAHRVCVCECECECECECVGVCVCSCVCVCVWFVIVCVCLSVSNSGPLLVVGLRLSTSFFKQIRIIVKSRFILARGSFSRWEGQTS